LVVTVSTSIDYSIVRFEREEIRSYPNDCELTGMTEDTILVINRDSKAEELLPTLERRSGSIPASRFEAPHTSIARWTSPCAHDERKLDSPITFYDV
jgi:hypothetical protein